MVTKTRKDFFIIDDLVPIAIGSNRRWSFDFAQDSNAADSIIFSKVNNNQPSLSYGWQRKRHPPFGGRLLNNYLKYYLLALAFLINLLFRLAALFL